MDCILRDEEEVDWRGRQEEKQRDHNDCGGDGGNGVTQEEGGRQGGAVRCVLGGRSEQSHWMTLRFLFWAWRRVILTSAMGRDAEWIQRLEDESGGLSLRLQVDTQKEMPGKQKKKKKNDTCEALKGGLD